MGQSANLRDPNARGARVSMASTADRKKAGGEPITIKKYANRRLYNTATSSYVTLDDLCQMVKNGVEFVVYDAKSGDDITRSVLTQIIVEEESKGQNLLPINFLRQLIGFYGDSLQAVVPRYLEQSMASFARNQEQMRDYLRETFDGLFPFGQFEEMGKQNMALIEQTMKMFSPFAAGAGASEAEGGKRPAPGSTGGKAAEGGTTRGELEDLKHKIEVLQQQLEALTARKGG